MSRIWQKSPKARVILAIFVVLALAIAAYLFFARKPRGIRDFELAQNAARKAQIETLKRDSDQDGLKDWEEAIFHTDPQAADTDTDTTQDGEEVRLGRDPLKQNSSRDPEKPNDLTATSTPLAAQPQADASQSANLTQIIAQSLGQQLIARRLTDPEAPLDPEAIGRSIANGLPTYTPEMPLLTLKNISLTKDDGDDAVQKWAQQFNALLKASFLTHHPIEPFILINALKDENYDSLAEIDSYIKAYDELADLVQRTPTPPSLANDALNFVRITLQFRAIAGAFRNGEKDPVTAVSAINPYFDLTQTAYGWHRDIRQKLANRHITFQQQ